VRLRVAAQIECPLVAAILDVLQHVLEQSLFEKLLTDVYKNITVRRYFNLFFKYIYIY
jgi:hypothetical protein